MSYKIIREKFPCPKVIDIKEAIKNLQGDISSLEKTINYYEKRLELLETENFELREKILNK